MPSPEKYRWLYSLTQNVTMTVCNKAAATQANCDKFGMPLHMLSVYYDLGNVKRVSLSKKSTPSEPKPNATTPVSSKPDRKDYGFTV